MTSSPTPSDTGAAADDAVLTDVDAAAESPVVGSAAADDGSDADATAAGAGPVTEGSSDGRSAEDAPTADASTADASTPDASTSDASTPTAARAARSAVPTAPPASGGSAAAVAPAAAPAAPARADAAAGEGGRVTRLEEEGEVAADYLEELLDIVDLDGDIDIDVADARAVVSIVGEDDGGSAALRLLAGPHGEVLEALQELTRLAVQTRTGERSRLMLDVAGYRAERREQLLVIAGEALRRVEQDGEPVALDPMNPFERKVVHDAVAAAGLVSDSDGVEPQRRVVIHPRQG